MVLHRSFLEKVSGLVEEKSRAGVTIQVGVEAPREVEARPHPGGRRLPVAELLTLDTRDRCWAARTKEADM